MATTNPLTGKRVLNIPKPPTTNTIIKTTTPIMSQSDILNKLTDLWNKFKDPTLWSTNKVELDNEFLTNANNTIQWLYQWYPWSSTPVQSKTTSTPQSNTKTNSAAAVSTGKTYQNTLPNASWAGLPNQWNTWTPVSSYDFMYKNPAPKIATKDNPVVKITGNNNTIPNYDDIKNMSQSDLQDFVDYYDLRTRKWQKLTETDEFKLMKANRRLQELQAPQTTSDPYADIIKQQEQIKIDKQKEMDAENDRIMEAERASEQAWIDKEMAYNAQQEEKQKNALWYILWWQWIGNSSAAYDRLSEISSNFDKQNQTLRAESYARLQRRNAELRWASRAELEKYDNKILDLQTKSADYFIDNAKRIEEFNKSTAKSMQERIQNIYTLSQAQSVEDLTSQEQEQAKRYARLILDNKGGINESLLKQIPSRLMAESLMQASIMKWAMPTTEYGFSNIGNGTIAVTDPSTGKVSFQQWPNQSDYDYREIGGKTYAINKNDPTDIQEVWWQISRQQAVTSYWSTPAVRNFNPWNIMDTGFWWQKVQWERFTRFDTPQQWFNALVSKIENIQAGNSSVYKPNMTILQYISKYAPASDNNNPSAYANMIAQKLWVSVNTTIWQLDPVKLASAHAQHEDKNSYKMLLDLWIITPDGSLWSTNWSDNTSMSDDNIVLPAKATEATKNALGFAQRMEDADRKMIDFWLEETYADRWRIWQTFQERAPNWLQWSKQKDLEMLKQSFITWILRKESWAAITDSEFARYDKQFFPQPWDSMDNIKQKQELRKNAVASMYQSVWRDEQGRSVVDLYKKRLGQTNANNSTGATNLALQAWNVGWTSGGNVSSDVDSYLSSRWYH